MKIGFIGLGLIGGSIAKAIRQYYPDAHLTAFDTDWHTLELAAKENVIQTKASVIDDAFANCDYIFLCAPVSTNNESIRKLHPYLTPDTILTDVGSVKVPIHNVISDLGLQKQFIGGHPMAGSEKSGYANARSVLIENAYYIVTPSDTVSEALVARYCDFIRTLHGIPVTLTPKEHDHITGVISHLPHILAAGLVSFVKHSDSPEEWMKILAAGGLKDITRIASSSPAMWQHICQTNQTEILDILSSYINDLTRIKNMIQGGRSEELYAFFDEAKEYRSSIPEASAGPIAKVYALYCDIIDEAGGIAALSTILASAGISIKNIGILHNREFEDGVLKIEFYEEDSRTKASALLKKYHYTVYER